MNLTIVGYITGLCYTIEGNVTLYVQLCNWSGKVTMSGDTYNCRDCGWLDDWLVRPWLVGSKSQPTNQPNKQIQKYPRMNALKKISFFCADQKWIFPLWDFGNSFPASRYAHEQRPFPFKKVDVTGCLDSSYNIYCWSCKSTRRVFGVYVCKENQRPRKVRYSLLHSLY